MPRTDYTYCKECGRHRTECGELSHERLCSRCGKLRQAAWNDGLHYHVGPAMLAWRRKMAASVGAILVDDILDAE